jgi:hypothetical protein
MVKIEFSEIVLVFGFEEDINAVLF